MGGEKLQWFFPVCQSVPYRPLKNAWNAIYRVLPHPPGHVDSTHLARVPNTTKSCMGSCISDVENTTRCRTLTTVKIEKYNSVDSPCRQQMLPIPHPH